MCQFRRRAENEQLNQLHDYSKNHADLDQTSHFSWGL